MSLSDTIGDALTVIRNGNRARKERVDLRASKLLMEILKVLRRERFIYDYRLIEDKKQGVLRVYLKKMDPMTGVTVSGTRFINRIIRISKPSRRVYAGKNEIPAVLNGLGLCVVSTPQGIMTGEEAKKRSVGGEVLLKVW